MDAFLLDLYILEETDKLQQTFNTEEGTTLSKLYLLDDLRSPLLFFGTKTFKEGALMAVNTQMVGAVYAGERESEKAEKRRPGDCKRKLWLTVLTSSLLLHITLHNHPLCFCNILTRCVKFISNPNVAKYLGPRYKNEHLAFATAFGSAYLATRGGSKSLPVKLTTVQQAKESIPVNASSS